MPAQENTMSKPIRHHETIPVSHAAPVHRPCAAISLKRTERTGHEPHDDSQHANTGVKRQHSSIVGRDIELRLRLR